jgi:thioredoxin 1
MNEITTTLKAFLADNKGWALVDFYAPWCQPCKMIAPVLASLEVEFPQISFWKADVDCNYLRSDVQSVPTLILYKDDIEISRKVGLASRPQLKEWLEICTQ